MGDSITNGSGGTANRGGYRGTLYDLLVAAGYDIDFVGTTTTNSSLLADMDHEGHGGWRIDQLDSNVAVWLAAIDTPDIVLLHIGTNDFGQGVDTVNGIHRLDALIGKIATLSPSSHVIVTNLMERGEPQNAAIQAEFNPFVEGVVADHLAAGHLVSFLDMRAAVPLSDMPDNLHPNQAGYDKMAAAWFAAIEDVIEPGDEVPPELRRARGSREGNQVIATFNKRVDAATATDPANYAVDGGIAVLAASLDALGRTVTLTTDPQTLGQTYTLTVNGVLDRVVPVPNEIAPDSQETFFPFTPRGFRHNVPESDCYTLVYSLEVPSSPNYQAAPPAYAVDNSRLIGSFDRIAYYLELQTATGDLRYAWASMDAFTSDPGLVGVPVLANGASFQQPVANLNIVSNAPGLSTGEAFAGNIEFWPTNYQGANSAGVPGASDADFDIGDNQSAGTYGSMQIHNTSDAETVIAFNRWGGTTGVADLGIGNNPTPVSGGIDWTFAQNAAGYSIKTLQVLVRAAGDFDPPALESARAGYGGNRIRVRFSEPVRAETVGAANFALDEGVEVLAATLGEDGREVLLETTFHPEGTPLTLTANGVRDTSPNANVIAADSTIAVEPAALPAEVIANIGAAADGYELVYSLDIPAAGTFNNRNPYAIDDHDAPGLISRIAYYVELQQPGGEVQYLWAAMDAFTGDKGKIGIPTFASGAVFQQPVANLDVISNVAGVVNGTGMAGGNIEFWPTNYGRPNTGAVPGADDATFDFGDERSASGTHGSMQIHNGGEGQTLFAMNNWGADGNPIALGIGNRPTADPDWTFAANAASYSRRVLHVMVLPAAPPPAPPEVLANVPEASDYELVYSLDIPAAGNLTSGAGFAPYTADFSGNSAPFSRVAYYLELQKTGDAEPTFAWVSMDAFTADRAKIGVPNLASGAQFQQYVANLNVVSNAAGVTQGEGLNGNIEFWPTNYNATNSLAIPGASGSTYDFGDNPTPGGYGSMQVHNYEAGQTIIALNRWGSAGNTTNALCVGIGNQPTGNPDWTFADNAGTYDLVRRLHVLVLPGVSDASGPEVAGATGSVALDRLIVEFDRTVAESAADPANFSLDGGLAVAGAALLPGGRSIALTTTAQVPGTLYTVGVTGVRSRATGALIAPGASVQFTAFTPPAVFGEVPEAADYDLIYHLDIPAATPQWNLKPIPYLVDEARYGERLFDRVAYLMELDGNWVFTSFDRHAASLSQIGVPTLGTFPAAVQRRIDNLNVASNVAGIVTGQGIETGNIEFWGGNYQNTNAASIPGASDTAFDFGDTMNAGTYGSMQVHNYGAAQTLFAYNNWGSNSGDTSEVGIGNRPTGEPDWTFSDSASTYTSRQLYVLARPGGAASGPAPEFLAHPCDRTANAGERVTFAVSMLGAGPFTYQWRLEGEPLDGATLPWLDLGPLESANAGSYDVVVTGPTFAQATSLPAELTVIVPNTPPTFDGYAFSMQAGTSATIPLAALLAKADDIDGDPLSVASADSPSAEGGAVALGAGGVTYTPPVGFTGADSFSISVSDGGASVVGTVMVTVASQPIDPAAPSASIAVLPGGGSIETVFGGTPGQEYGFQRSLDLIDWDTLAAAVAGDDGILVFVDPAPPEGEGQVFYRTISPVPPTSNASVGSRSGKNAAPSR